MISSPRLLDGVRVLELARTLAGPWMGQLLADMGADVVKAERRGVGDETRAWGPPFVREDDGGPKYSVYFHGCNRGKRSVEVDLDDAGDRALLLRLISNADIVIENFKVGTLARHGLGGQAMCRSNPRLIWCAITAFGQTGPYAERPGYDFVIQAMSGLLSLNSSGQDSPRRLPIPTSDLFTGVYGALAAVAALNRRNSTDEGSFIDLSLFDTQVSTLGLHVLGHLLGTTAVPQGPQASIVPQIVVPASDGHVALVITTDIHAGRLFSGLGLAGLADDPRFEDRSARRGNAEGLAQALATATGCMPTEDLIALMARLDVPAGRVNSIGELIRDQQTVHRGLVAESGDGSHLPAVRMPALFDGDAAISGTGAPRLGEHSRQVFDDPDWGGTHPGTADRA